MLNFDEPSRNTRRDIDNVESQNIQARGKGCCTKKKQKEEMKQLLASIPIDTLPSKDVVKTLFCVENTVDAGLRNCVINILQNRLIN